MNKYRITLTRVLSMDYDIEANTQKEAEAKAIKLDENALIDDYEGTTEITRIQQIWENNGKKSFKNLI